MEITVNGVQESCSPCSLAQLVAAKELAAQSLVIELNQQIIKQELWESTSLRDGDVLELLSFVGGG